MSNGHCIWRQADIDSELLEVGVAGESRNTLIYKRYSLLLGLTHSE